MGLMGYNGVLCAIVLGDRTLKGVQIRKVNWRKTLKINNFWSFFFYEFLQNIEIYRNKFRLIRGTFFERRKSLLFISYFIVFQYFAKLDIWVWNVFLQNLNWCIYDKGSTRDNERFVLYQKDETAKKRWSPYLCKNNGQQTVCRDQDQAECSGWQMVSG